MKYSLTFILLLHARVTALAQQVVQVQNPNQASYKAYESLQIPDLSKYPSPTRVINVAVIDNGFNLDHRSIKPFLFRNPKEINGNGKDEDGNGYADDLIGWDIADQDNDVSIPDGKADLFFHGTMIAGVVTRTAELCFGAKASERIKILPVKVVSDKATKLNYEMGYDGIEYAMKSNADIIICAWNGGIYDATKYDPIFREAQKKGILILSSSGNFYSEQCDPPASINSVYAVSAVDSQFIKLKTANYGQKIDLVAQGDLVYAPHPGKENAYAYADGTSAAAALVTGCAAVLKSLDPKAGPQKIMAALKNTALPVDEINIRKASKLGAGIPQLNKAVEYLLNEQDRARFFNSKRSKGDLLMNRSSDSTNWDIQPNGGIRGFNFRLRGEWKDLKTPIQFFSGDTLICAYSPAEFPVNVFIQAPKVRVAYSGKRGKADCGLSYEAVPIDSTSLYCKETVYFTTPQGEFSDGSGAGHYANNCGCKWQITAPLGKRIKITFDKFDTQAKIDFVALYDGEYTIPDNTLASFSGSELPPVMVSRSNQVLVWFVTDDIVTAQGWHLHYTFTDEAPGAFPPASSESNGKK